MLQQRSVEAFETAARSIFRIEAKWWGDSAGGTAFAVARLQRSKRLVLATARHVIEAASVEPVEWLVQQFDRNGRSSRQVRFKTDPRDEHQAVYTHRKMDTGMLVLASCDKSGPQFSPDGENVLKMIDEHYGVAPGTTVAWAGFPDVAEDLLKHPQLCCFQGVISATVDRDDKRYYLVDGHSTHGISGSPLWHWSEKNDCLEVAGVVSGYGQIGGLPGFCLVEPVDSFRALFKSWQDHWEKERAQADAR